ncbi:MAG: phage tail protein [Wolbachia sp.]
MSVHIEVEVIESVNAKRRKVELAIVRALNKTAIWLKLKAAKEISEEKKIKLTVMRKRLRIFKTSKLEVLIRANLYDIKASSMGKMRQTKRGAKIGKHEFIGAFTATMPRGYKGAFKREGKTALPIKEVKLPLEPEASKVIRDLVNYEVEKVFAKCFERDITRNV